MITLTHLHEDHGSIVEFAGVDEEGNAVIVAVERRYAYDLVDALARGEYPEADAPDWAVRRTS